MTNRDLAEQQFRPLGLNTRAINALCCADIYTVRELKKITDRELRRIPGIGPKAIAALGIFVRKVGRTVEIHTLPKTVAVIFEPQALTDIDSWAFEYDGIVSRAEAIRRLVELGLKAKR